MSKLEEPSELIIEKDREGVMQYVKTLRYVPTHLFQPGKVFAKLFSFPSLLIISTQKVRCMLQDRSTGKAIVA
jgi:hypothetical protein